MAPAGVGGKKSLSVGSTAYFSSTKKYKYKKLKKLPKRIKGIIIN
jgi:hypothetical protein